MIFLRLLAILTLCITGNSFATSPKKKLKCDLKVSKYKAVKEAKSEIVSKTIKSTYYIGIKDFKSIDRGRIGYEIITYRENVPEKDFGQSDDWEYANCSNKTIITGECEIFKNIDDKDEYRCPTNITFTCSRIPLEKKSITEYQEDLCYKATECASAIENTDELDAYIKLRDSMCAQSTTPVVSKTSHHLGNRKIATEKN